MSHFICYFLCVFHLVFQIYFLFVFKSTLLKYKFIIDKPEILSDDTQCKIAMSKLLAGRNIVFDET